MTFPLSGGVTEYVLKGSETRLEGRRLEGMSATVRGNRFLDAIASEGKRIEESRSLKGCANILKTEGKET